MSNTIYQSKIKVNCPLVHDEDGFYHLIYRTTNAKNGKIYIGKHSTKDPYDDYMGSGKGIMRALKKYGIGNFTKEILYCFTNEKEAYLKEEELVTQEFIDRNDTYNIMLGGKGMQSGENHPMYGKHQSKETIDKRSKALSGEKNPMYGKHHTQEAKEKISKASKERKYTIETREKISKAHIGEKNPMYGMTGEKNPMYGKHHTQEAKEKISKARKGKYVGEKSPLFGKHPSQETRDKMSKARKGKYTGENAPLYGKYGENHPCYGKHLSQEHKDKISKANTGENNGFAKTILKLDEFGNVIAEYGCMKTCCEQENISNRKKLNKIIKEHILYNGFYFEFKLKN